MPKIIKKRPVNRKPVEETEEVKHAALHALDALKKRQKQAIMIVSAAAVIAIVLLVFNFYGSSRDTKAHALEIEATSYYFGEKPYDTMPDTERWKKALELYQAGNRLMEASPARWYRQSILLYASFCRFVGVSQAKQRVSGRYCSIPSISEPAPPVRC